MKIQFERSVSQFSFNRTFFLKNAIDMSIALRTRLYARSIDGFATTISWKTQTVDP